MEPSAYSCRYKTKRYSLCATMIVCGLHVVIISVAINLTSTQKNSQLQPSIQLFKLQEERLVQDALPELPVIHFSPITTLIVLPSPDFMEYRESSIDYAIPYELPNKDAKQYSDIFDPRLRKKLIEARSINHKTSERSEGWTKIDGREFIDKGDGLCNVSMQNIDAHSRAKNWGFTRCGKTDSEKSMDRVMADYESHKRHP